MIFVIDSGDRERLAKAKTLLHRCFGDKDLANAPILVFANKQDLDEKMSNDEIYERLEITNTIASGRKTNLLFQSCSARTGDGIWEGLRLYDGVLSFLDAHLDRLYEAALFIDLDIGMDRGALTQAIWGTLRANDMHSDVHLRVMVTRGRKRKPFQHPALSVYGATVVIIAGTLKIGTPFICGPYSGKVKGLLNDLGEQVEQNLALLVGVIFEGHIDFVVAQSAVAFGLRDVLHALADDAHVGFLLPRALLLRSGYLLRPHLAEGDVVDGKV
mgnify:CR=1 FL=1